MAPALAAAPSPAQSSPMLVRMPEGPSPRARAAAAVLEPAIVACEAAIAYRVRQGTRPPGGGLLTALVDAVEVGQTTLDLARRSSPLLPAAAALCREAFARAEEACRTRGEDPLLSCAAALDEAQRGLPGAGSAA